MRYWRPPVSESGGGRLLSATGGGLVTRHFICLQRVSSLWKKQRDNRLSDWFSDSRVLFPDYSMKSRRMPSPRMSPHMWATKKGIRFLSRERRYSRYMNRPNKTPIPIAENIP